MEVYRVIHSLFRHLWGVLPVGFIPGTDSMTELLLASAAISWLPAAQYNVNLCSSDVLLLYLLV